MRLKFLSLVILALVGALRTDAPKAPFRLALVPSKSSNDGSSIAMSLNTTMSRNMRHKFYVVLTNVSEEPQAVWEDWNSCGYKTISFEFTMADGRKIIVSKSLQDFTRNFPSTFLIQPGEHQVYPIWLDRQWEAHPALPQANEMSIKVKAVYQVKPTAEAAKSRVWTGWLESKTYNCTLRQW